METFSPFQPAQKFETSLASAVLLPAWKFDDIGWRVRSDISRGICAVAIFNLVGCAPIDTLTAGRTPDVSLCEQQPCAGRIGKTALSEDELGSFALPTFDDRDASGSPAASSAVPSPSMENYPARRSAIERDPILVINNPMRIAPNQRVFVK